jgi:Arc/MetJ-type ribon-helix-helix transcriptional regulator
LTIDLNQGNIKGPNQDPGGAHMATLTQKKISISSEQNEFLENYKQWGFTDQSSIVREALTQLIKEVKTRQRKSQMAQKASELLSDYGTDKELTTFTELDGEDFI